MENCQLFEIIPLSGINYSIIKFNFTSNILKKAKEQARKKSCHTMDFNQSSIARGSELKYQKQLQGILAEIGIKLLLEEFFSQRKIEAEVIRWDDVRTDDFKSPKNEYDLKIVFRGEEFLIECRSSINYKADIVDSIANLDIIGPYTSDYKKNEKGCDFYIRPLYQYNELKDSILDLEIEDYLEKNKMQLYIICGITYENIIKKGYLGSLGQRGTKYRLIKMEKCEDISKFLETIEKILLNLNGGTK